MVVLDGTVVTIALPSAQADRERGGVDGERVSDFGLWARRTDRHAERNRLDRRRGVVP
jgi:hypothetical protein